MNLEAAIVYNSQSLSSALGNSSLCELYAFFLILIGARLSVGGWSSL